MNVTTELLTSATTTIITVGGMLGGGIAWVYGKLEQRRKAGEIINEVRYTEVSKRLTDCETDRLDMRGKIIALESGIASRAPMWIRSQNGTIISVSPEFVRLFCAPRGLGSQDVIGKNFADIPAFKSELVKVLSELDTEATRGIYASRDSIEISPGSFAYLHKCVFSDSSGSIFFVGYAFPRGTNA